jgi:hypothetical protein
MPAPIHIHSGGQTGVDRAALDAAQSAGVPIGGWCPKGRRAEDGPISPHYPLRETPTPEYAERTAWNVRDADATLVLTRGTPTGGTAATVEVARDLGKPFLVVEPEDAEVATVIRWLSEHGATTLNVAGPRESTAPGVYADAKQFMTRLLRKLTDG